MYHKHAPLCGVPERGRKAFGSAWTRCGARDLDYLPSRSRFSKLGGPIETLTDPDRPGRVRFSKFFAGWAWAPSGYTRGTPTDSLPIFDLNFADDIGRCSGEQCRDAADAVDVYHRLLDQTSSLRTLLLRLLLPKPFMGRSPLNDLSSAGIVRWYQSRYLLQETNVCKRPRVTGVGADLRQPVPVVPPPCESVTALARHMVAAQELLVPALQRLRASAAALEVTCVAAQRSLWWAPSFHETASLLDSREAFGIYDFC